jgi:sideroflexin-5
MRGLIEEQEAKEKQMIEKSGDKHTMNTQEEIDRLRVAQTVVSTAFHPDTKELLHWT